ncbi:glutaredoxin [Phascolomyces articulosus]|uniref:Glutaredoxin n=1 Tax=Phascolomyces articulosus TaxID=60185 RepID=A0AAD5PE29_9FUNG|nr:glutaredoxin [Phascolomyces articulosus]
MSAIAQGIKELVKKSIAENPVMVFSKSYCPYCTGAKDLFDDLSVNYKALELDIREDGPDVQKALFELTGQKTVPNVFINSKHIGGFSDIDEAFKSGKLETLLKEAGIKESKL